MFFACKKETFIESNEEIVRSASESSSLEGFNIDNAYGFLVFDSVQHLKEFSDFLLSSTHGEVQDYLQTIGFNSLGSEEFSDIDTSELVTPEQASFYALNADGIIEIQDVIMKPISPTTSILQWEFLLTVTNNNLDSTTYSNLASGTYDDNRMNKFATGTASRDEGLFAFIKDTPWGHEETEPVSPSSEENGRFLGWGWKRMYTLLRVEGDCIIEVAYERYTIFGIWTGGEREVVLSTVCS